MRSSGALDGVGKEDEPRRSETTAPKKQHQSRHSRTKSQGWWNTLLSTFGDESEEHQQHDDDDPARGTSAALPQQASSNRRTEVGGSDCEADKALTAAPFPGIVLRGISTGGDQIKQEEQDDGPVTQKQMISPIVIPEHTSIFDVPRIAVLIVAQLSSRSERYALSRVNRRCFALLARLALLEHTSCSISPSVSIPVLDPGRSIAATLSRVSTVYVVHDCSSHHRVDGRLISHLSPLVGTRTYLLEQERQSNTSLSLIYHSLTSAPLRLQNQPALYLLVVNETAESNDWNLFYAWLTALHATALETADLLACSEPVPPSIACFSSLPFHGSYVGLTSGGRRPEILGAIVARFLALGARALAD